MITNYDSLIQIELGKLGINKTFSKKVPIEKISTTPKLVEILEQAIYFVSSYDKNDKTGIKYHHFITIVKLDNNIKFIRIVIKEYTKDVRMNNKFYYHQFEYLK